MKLYKYHGTISSMTGQNRKAQEIILHDTSDDDKAPTRLKVVGGIAKYIYDRDWTDTEILLDTLLCKYAEYLEEQLTDSERDLTTAEQGAIDAKCSRLKAECHRS